MDELKQVTFTFEPAFESVDRIRNAIKSACRAWFTNPAAETVINDFCQVISELVNNAVEHGNCTEIKGELTLANEEALFTLITDGTPFDPFLTPAAMPALNSLGDLPEGGFGLAIIQKLSDRRSYKFKDGMNIISVGKNFSALRGEYMEIKVEVDSNIIFIKMAGSLVASSIEEIKAQVQKLIDKKYVYIVFDMSRVDFVDSSGLGLCISTARELAASSGKLVCSGLRENVRKLFAMTRADQKISVMATRMEAFDYMLAKLEEEVPGASIL